MSVPKPKYAVERSERYSRREVFTNVVSMYMFTWSLKTKSLALES